MIGVFNKLLNPKPQTLNPKLSTDVDFGGLGIIGILNKLGENLEPKPDSRYQLDIYNY
jgi:hypothetical protein